jgi:integrase
LSVIADYVKRLANLLSGEGGNKEKARLIARMADGIKARRPVRKNRNSGLNDKGLDQEQIALLFEVFKPGSELNPFVGESVQIRNRLMFLVLYHLGIRGGELLNIRIKDIDFSNNQIVVVRRADQKDDPRTNQPRAKTLDRRLPMKDTLAKEIHKYIVNYRRKIVQPGQPDYLFVTHKEGPTKGLPVTIPAYRKVFKVVREISPILHSFSGHSLRHHWNEIFSNYMDSMDNAPSEIDQEQQRSYLMGWKPGSGTAATYNRRFTQRKSNEAALKLQEDMIRLPSDMKNGKSKK